MADEATNNPPKPTILVKKADGSFVRVEPHEVGKQDVVSTPAPGTVLKEGEVVKPSSDIPAPKKTWNKDDSASLLDPALHHDLPMEVNSKFRSLATTAPVTDIFQNEAAASVAHQQPKDPGSQTADRPKPSPPPLANSGGSTESRPVLHDIRPPEPKQVSMGPIDELRTFSLVDFRRLHADPKKATELLQEKFLVLQKEAFLLYIDGVRAWQESPLYRNYLSIVERALIEQKKVEVIIAEEMSRGGIKKAEFMALVHLNTTLSG